MIKSLKTKYDGMISFLGGMNSSVMAHLLKPDQSFQLWNATVRDGQLRPRPGFDKLTLTFPTVEIGNWFRTQHNQGDIIFKTDAGETLQVWSVGGRFFSIRLGTTNMVEEITPTLQTSVAIAFTAPAVAASATLNVASGDLVRVGYPIMIEGKIYNVTAKLGSDSFTVVNVNDTPATVHIVGSLVSYLDPNSEKTGIMYWQIAEGFLIGQDGLSRAFIFDGGSSRRSDPTKNEIPTGTVMAYGIGRLWVAIGGKKFVASDIVYGESGTNDYGGRDAILKFTENNWLAGGGAFSAPGDITAMAFISSLDTSTGQGPLMVFTEDAICSVNAPSDRDMWALVTNPIQTISLVANGATGFYSTIPTVNGDIFYRSLDGLRTFFLARREFGNWGNTPISGEIDDVMAKDSPSLLKYSSAIVFDNRLLFTLRNRPTRFGSAWKGMGALDFDPVFTMFTKSAPVWDGIWTGIDPMWLFTGKYGKTQRAFAAVLNADGENELWEISSDHQFDNDDGRIKWTIVSRGFDFQNPMEMLRLQNTEVFLRQVIGRCELTLSYRSDDYPCWFAWKDQPTCANYRKCTSWSNCETPITFRGGYRTRIPFGQPQDDDETNDGRPARLGYVHQLKLEIEGYCELVKMRLSAIEVDEESEPRVDQPENCEEINCCETDFFAWRSEDATGSGGELSS